MSDDVELIKNAAGKDKCPQGKMALYTNINFNMEELGDILLIAPNVQLDQAQLEYYGFDVGHHDGVSCVVNKMSQAATLVAGLNLNGQILNVSSMSDIPSLVEQGWNDKTRSVVAAPVELVELKMSSASPVVLKIKESVELELTIENLSDIMVPDTTLEVSVSNAGVVSIGAFEQPGTVPAKSAIIVRVPVTGSRAGQTSLTFTLHTPVGFINQGDNVYPVQVRVEFFSVQLTMESIDPISIGLNKTESVELIIKNLSTMDIPVTELKAVAANRDILSVGTFSQPGTIPLNDSVTVPVPVTGLKNGESALTFSLILPEEFDNTGDSQRVVQVKVQTAVTLRITLDRDISLVTGESRQILVKFTNESEQPVDSLGVDIVSGDTTLFTVGDFSPEVYLPPNDSVVSDVELIPVVDKTGSTRLICSLTLPPGYTNDGDSNKVALVNVTAERELEVLQTFQSSWVEEGGYKYSYMLTMKSANVRVTLWELSFELPLGARVSDTWYETQKNWLEKRVDGEMVYLTNKSGHTIDPGIELPLQIQLVYPEQSPAYEYIYSLSLRQLQK
ncbi:hypothetical protein [Photorhabdus namnaonensis]|uniref:Uncharacterized protein n=1 Tax=Photorhabdus namnaonensis TaxID=1851568 RepID=A0A1B8YLH6_9GAMM|nr:hypothetical protein [Photorhabdus namnaonensis]OCA55959.1 hypothetical protein Phpb_00912 [Photorhabdus namnaonensis]